MLAGLSLWAYAPAWTIPPHADDLMLMIAASNGLFGGAYEGGFLFRPLELLLIELGDWLHVNPQWPRVVNFVGLMAATGLLFALARRIWPAERALPFIVAALFACHPINTATISQFDTVSQQLATLMILAALAWYLFGPKHRTPLYHVAGSSLLMLALLTKEVAVGAVFGVPLALAAAEFMERRQPLPTLVRRTLVMLVGVAGLFVIYLGLRAWAGVGLSADDDVDKYVMSGDPLLVVKNVLLLLGSSGYLGSSLDVFVRNGPGIVPLTFTAAFHGFALLGAVVVLRSLRAGSIARRNLAGIAAAAVMLLASLFPVSITGWPSEVHSYLPVPFYILIMTFFALHGWRAMQRRWRLPGRPLAAVGVIALLVCSAWMLAAVREKLAYSALVGARSQAFMAQMEPWYAQTPVPTSVPEACVVHPDGAEAAHYSVFVMSDQSLLQPMVDWLNHLYGRRLHLPVSPEVDGPCDVYIEVTGNRLRLPPAAPQGDPG